MKSNDRKKQPAAEVVELDQKGLVRLFNRRARLLGISGTEALDRIKKGKAGDNYLWSDLGMLATMLSGKF